MRRDVQIAVTVAALVCLLVPSRAQVTVGDNVNLNLSGNLNFGYNGAFGETVGDGHGIGVGGQGQLTGSYYNPNFLAFRLQPYYNRSQSNSDFQSITNSSGLVSQVDLFRGSHFPGSVFFGKSMDGTGQFGIPGLSGLTTHGGSRSYGITWSEDLPDWPTLTASYSSNAEHSEVFGSNSEDHSTVHIFNLQSFYTIDGFHLNGLYMRQTQAADFPGLVTGELATTSSYSSNTISLQATHRIPLNGEWGGGVSHSTLGGESFSGTQTSNNDGSNNQYNTGVSITPWSKFSFAFNTNYYTNVYATLQEQILQAGGIPLQFNQGWSTSALSLNAFAFYTVTSHISVTGNWGRQILYLPEGDRSVDRFGGSVNFNYAQPFLGSFYFSVGAVDMASEQGNQGAGLTGNVNYSKRINGWEFGAGFNYAQFVQTLLATYTTSNYKYDASVRRRWRSGLYWTGSYFGNHSGLTQIAGNSNRSEGVNTSILFKRYSLNGTYTHSNGTSILTSHGLVQVPSGIPPGVLSQEFQFGSKGFGFGATAVVRRWVVNGSYSKSNGNAFGADLFNSFQSKSLNGRLQYRVRKMYFNAGFTRFQQTFGGLGTKPIDYNTFFVGFSRWFNVF